MARSKNIAGKEYISYGHNTGRKTWVLKALVPAMQRLEKSKDSNYHFRYIYNRIKTLSNSSSAFHAEKRKHVTNKHGCKLNMAGSELEYFMHGGESFIDRLILSGAGYVDARKKGNIAGLNKIVRDEEGKWEIKGPIDTVQTRHIAISGDAWRIEETLLFMSKMIKKAHPEDSYFLTNGNKSQQGYSCFFSPCKKGKDDGWEAMQRLMPAQGAMSDLAVRQAIVDRLSACIEVAGKKDSKKLNWTIQGSASEIFHDAFVDLKSRNKHLPGYGVDLSQQTVHFFNPHTDPMKLSDIIEDVFKGPSESGLITSALKSPGNKIAAIKGHKKYQDKVIAENKAKNPEKSNAAAELEKHRVTGMGHGAGKMVVKFGTMTAAAIGALVNDTAREQITNMFSSVGESLVNNPYGTGAALGLGYVIKGHEVITQNTPRMLALASLTKANFTDDRRHLDQLTEINNIKAAGQLHNLSLGLSI
ncbi:hypothetical protein MNBD_GAMMA09-605 [hydrothermal vent metagenome]|uniref:Uncharacterized protein n=1 Tax=hydrothermal vent metagenome TaxID=652676 RepID=A0A3B0Y3J5_9ZZZZ